MKTQQPQIDPDHRPGVAVVGQAPDQGQGQRDLAQGRQDPARVVQDQKVVAQGLLAVVDLTKMGIFL